MPRETRCRRVEALPQVKVFKPAGLPLSCLEETLLKVEEMEAIRLKDLLGLEQEECASRMEISRPTFQRILVEAHQKIADALVNGKALRVEGGNYCLGQGYCRRLGRRLHSYEECVYFSEPGIVSPERGESTMQSKVAVCSTGPSPSDAVDGRFGRCRYFVVCDLSAGDFSAVSNDNLDLSHGAGTGTAQTLISMGVSAVLTNRIGPKAFALLRRSGIKVFQAPEACSAEEAIRLFEQGQLTELEQANN